MNTAENQTQLNEVSMLSLVQDPETLSQEQALLRMRQIVNSPNKKAGHIYNSMLNTSQREVVCHAAGLTREDVKKAFEELTEDARIAIKRALIMLGQMVDYFRNAHAMSDKHFLDKNSVKKVDAKSTKHTTREYISKSNMPKSYEDLQQRLQQGE